MKNIFKKKKLIIIVIILIAAAAIFTALNKNKGPVETAVNTVALEKKSIEQIISVKAPLEGIEKADVVSPLNYEIIDIRVKEGDLVKKDQILAVLDSEELEKQISSEENQIQLAQLEQQESLKQQQVEYDKALLNVAELEKSFNQSKELLENGIITKEAYEKSESSLKEARKSLETFNAVDGKVVLSSAKAKSIEIQKQELEKKKEDLSKVFIKSPIDGTITRVNVNLGRYAKDTSSEKSMFTVENLDKLQMKVFISEFDIGKISLGQEVEITSDVMGKDKTAGIVSRISPTAEQKDNNTMERVIPVVIDIIEKPANLIAGVSATAKIKVARAENIFAVSPGMLITDEENQNKVFTLNDDNTVKSVIVETGLETDLEIEIRSGELADGMKVIANPDMSFTDGMTVRPNDVAE